MSNHQQASSVSFSYLAVIRSTVFAFLISSVLFIPMVGIKLSGWGYRFAFDQAFWLVGLVTLVRFFTSIIVQVPKWKALALRIFAQRAYLPVVEDTKNRFRSRITILLILLAIIANPLFLGQYWLSVWITALIYVLLGLGLNIVIGFAGLLDLGYVGFYAIGAYTVALLFKFYGFGFWESLPIAAFAAAFFGAILAFPVLRMHGDYLAIVTLGFGEIIRLVIHNWLPVTGGPNGIRLPKPFISFFGLNFSKGNDPYSFHNFFHLPYSEFYRPIFTYYLLVLFVAAVAFVCYRLKEMPLGRTWEAIREDELACRSLGINAVTVKLAAFTMGAFVGGIGGAFFAVLTEFVSPTSFSFIESALVVAIVVLGGLGSVPGVIISAIVLTLIPEILRDTANIRILVFGVIMLVVMIWRPRGLTRIVRPRFNRP